MIEKIDRIYDSIDQHFIFDVLKGELYFVF